MPETITRLCGHEVNFEPHGDQFDDARRDKLRHKRCAECGRAKNREDNARHPKRVKKGQEVKLLPVGCLVVLMRKPDGGWKGSISSPDGVEVDAEMNGAIGVVQKLVRKWLAANGASLTGRVQE